MAEPNPTVARIYADNELHGTLIASGYGVTLSVSRGHLVVVDGIGRSCRERRIPRMPHTVTRLFIIGHTGYFSLEASRWLADAGISWSQLSGDGDILATSGPARTDARLLRAQAYAAHETSGLEVTRSLLLAKLHGQASNVRDILREPGAARMIDETADELRRCTTLEDMRTWEGQAAMTYWQVWADRVHAPLSPADMSRVPAHWLGYSTRTSLRWDGYQRNKEATDPINTMLNYVYRIAEVEAVHACHAVGLSPVLGIMHADKAGRDSMALDLIEAARPFCDRLILGKLDCGLGVPRDSNDRPAYLDRRWFTETREGVCRLVPPLTHEIASHAADIGAVLRPHVEQTARRLASEASGHVVIPAARKAKANVAPARSSRTARFKPGTVPADILPDHVWKSVCDLIPEPPKPRRKTGRPRDTDDRKIVAALAAHELLGVPWGVSIPVGVSTSTCRARKLEWDWAQDADGISAWDRMASVIQGSGHLSALIS